MVMTSLLTPSATNEGSTIQGGAGDDSVDNADAANAGSKFFIKGELVMTSIVGSRGKDTIYAGKGDDTIG